MVSVLSLWLPVLLSAVFVFVVSSVIHMVLKYHSNDFIKVPKEEEVMDALRPFNLEPGNYSMPRAADMKDMNSPEYKEKLNKGPNAMLTVLPNGSMNMGSALLQWFLFCVVVGIFSGYVAGIKLAPGAAYMEVFRISSVVAFCSYSLGLWSNTIWYKHSLSATIKSTFDGLVYGLVTGGVFIYSFPLCQLLRLPIQRKEEVQNFPRSLDIILHFIKN